MIPAVDEQQSIHWGGLALLSLVVLLAAVWPVSTWAQWLRPEFCAMLVMYLVLAIPFRIGMGFAWGLGLVLDVLEGAILGQNALSLTVVAYLCFLLHTRIRLFSQLEQMLSIFVLVGINQLVGNWIQGLTGVRYYDLAFLLPALTSALLWPWMLVVLNRVAPYSRQANYH